jgi:hypothetical protein
LADGRDPALNARFTNVKLFKDNTTAGVNYEYIWNMTNAVGDDPEPTSLFNIDTLKAMLNAGNNTIDIIAETKSKNADLNLKAFDNVTKALKLETNEQSYMVYLWIKYLLSITARRVPEGGS